MSTRVHLDPTTNELVLPSGKRVPNVLIAGGSVMSSDDLHTDRNDGGMDIDLDDDDDDAKDDRRLQDDDDDDDGDDRDRDDDWTPPDKAQWERMRAALKNERRDRKRVQREYEDKVKNLTSTASATNEIEVEKARIAERTKVTEYWVGEVVRAKAAAEFTAQGATAEMAERLSNLVDLKKVEYDERDKEFDGLEDEIEDIINANQDFFRPKDRDDDKPARRQGQGRPRVDGGSRGGGGGGGGGAPRKKPRTADLLANQALGRGQRRRPSR